MDDEPIEFVRETGEEHVESEDGGGGDVVERG